MDVYQNYLRTLESSEPDTKVIGVGLQIWQPTLFGDTVHLNLRGALANSEYLRESLNKAGENDITFSDVAPTPINLYAQNDQTQFWDVPPAIQGAKISLVTNAPLPKLAYPGSAAWLYEIPDDTSGQTVVGVQARAIALDAKTNYALSVLVKPINTGEVSLHLDWPGGSRGSVGWDFKKRLISYSGKMNMLNSGVVTCLGGWVELYLSATSGSIATSYPGSVVSLSAADDASAPASAYVYNATLERGLWPTNYCTLQPDEVSTIPLPAKAASGSNVHNNFGTK